MQPFLLLLSLWNPAALPNMYDSIPQKRTFKVTIATQAAQRVPGYFYALGDSTISLTARPVRTRAVPADSITVRRYGFTDLDYVKLKRQGSVGRGILFGALTGLGSGVVAGFIEGDDPHTTDCFFCIEFTAGQKAAFYGLFFSLCGAVVGAVIGAVAHKKFFIGGNRQKFEEMKTTVLQKVYGTSRN